MESEPRNDDEYERSLAENYALLARAIVVRACLDYVAIQHPKLMRRYVWHWRHSETRDEHGRMVRLPLYPAWLDREKVQIEHYFADGGGELAQSAGVYDLVCKVRKYKRTKRSNDTIHRFCRRNRQFRKLAL